MSRLGKRPIKFGENVEVKVGPSDVTVKGPKGELTCSYDPKIQIAVEGNEVKVSNPSPTKDAKAKHGLYWALIRNLVEGVTQGFEKTLELVGVGYRVQQKGKGIEIAIGFSHPVNVDAPEGVELKVEGNNKIIVSGIDKQKVGQLASEIRAIRSPDPYKGKGIRYSGEYIRKKQGKTVKK